MKMDYKEIKKNHKLTDYEETKELVLNHVEKMSRKKEVKKNEK